MKNEKISIKDLFSEDTNESNEILPSKNRMVELMESFEKKDEIIKEKIKTVDLNKLEEESKRLKTIARVDEAPTYGQNSIMNTQFNPKNAYQGETINTAFQNSNIAKFDVNPHSNHPHNPQYSYLQPAEAARLAISRTLNSGAPINNIGFYDEINRELNTLGFNSKSALDIKQMLLKMIQD